MAEQKIWERSADSGAGGYKNLAQNYRTKHGNLVGFLEKYGAFQRGDKLYKVRVDGERIKLASLSGYNAYQQRRQGREGYNRVRRELLALGVDAAEVNEFIKADKAEYKDVVSEVKRADTRTAEPVQKGHVGSLETGSPDVARNIEPELRSVNVGKQGQSPIPEALLAEGRPRTSMEAFLQWKDPSGLPKPTDYTYEQRQELRAAKTPEQIDDLLTKFDDLKTRAAKLTQQGARFVSGLKDISQQAVDVKTQRMMDPQKRMPIDPKLTGPGGLAKQAVKEIAEEVISVGLQSLVNQVTKLPNKPRFKK